MSASTAGGGRARPGVPAGGLHLAHLAHLARRLLGSLRPGGPDPVEEAWARHRLISAEIDLWASMSGPDRRHAVAVAHRVAAALDGPDGAGVPRPVLAAALLHDVGKVDAGLGTWNRVAVTALALVAGRSCVVAWDAVADAAPGGAPGAVAAAGWRGRAGRYLRHDAVGEAMLVAAGSDPLTSNWAGDHHAPPGRWRVDPGIGHVLKAADDD